MIELLLILVLQIPQEARYLRCESPEDIEFYADIREDLSASYVEDWIRWNETCVRMVWYAEEEVYDQVLEWAPTSDPEVVAIWLYERAGVWYALREEVPQVDYQGPFHEVWLEDTQ